MHQFLHGIRRAFLAACGGSPLSCLLALELEENEENCDLRAGYLPPKRGDEEENAAENCDLLHEGYFPPKPTVKETADNKALQAPSDGQTEDGVGALPPSQGDGQDGVLPPRSNEIGNTNCIGNLFQISNERFPIATMHTEGAWNNVSKHLHAAIGNVADERMAFIDPIISPVKPRVDPKVKKKNSLLLCITINMPFHPGEYGHDDRVQCPHYAPYSNSLYMANYPSLYIACKPPRLHRFSSLPSTAASSFNASL